MLDIISNCWIKIRVPPNKINFDYWPKSGQNAQFTGAFWYKNRPQKKKWLSRAFVVLFGIEITLDYQAQKPRRGGGYAKAWSFFASFGIKMTVDYWKIFTLRSKMNQSKKNSSLKIVKKVNTRFAPINRPLFCEFLGPNSNYNIDKKTIFFAPIIETKMLTKNLKNCRKSDKVDLLSYFWKKK